jgi:hypothetical protein
MAKTATSKVVPTPPTGQPLTEQPSTEHATKKPAIATRRNLFIAHLRQSANVSRSARSAGLCVSALYRHRARTPAFAAQWDSAIAEVVDALEEAVLGRARDGTEKAVYYGGERIGKHQLYSDALAMFVLKSKRPEVYARALHSGESGEAVDSLSDGDAEQEFDDHIARLKAL